MKKGFTLAEVLITLGIIGIVAALTIPNLIGNYEKYITVVQLKRAYSIISQVTERGVAEYGDMNSWDSFYDEKDNCEKYYNKYQKPYIQIAKGPVKFDRYYDADLYKKYGYKGPFSSVNGSPWYDLEGNQKLSITVGFDLITTDNIFIRVDMSNNIIVDLNGPQKPNKAGRDVFWFSINKSQNKVTPLSYYAGERECGTVSEAGSWGGGYTCADKIMKDGWTIKDDYPW